LLEALAVAAISVVMVAAPVQAVTIRVPCQGCDEWPIWVQGILVLAGVGLAIGVFYVPIRLARAARTERQRSFIVLGGVVLLTIALVVGARALVILFPG
jgi:hypothetical protein